MATGSPSTAKWRTRSSIFAITSTPVSGSASVQWAINGYAPTIRSHVSTSRARRIAVSLALAVSVTDHVPLSAGRVSHVTES